MHVKVTDPALSQVLAWVVPVLYRSLAALGPNEAPVARGMLHGTRCVWVGNGFAPAGKVAFKGSLDLSPWLYVMPAELAPFKDLLLSYGAADGFSAVQYCSVLQDMAEATGVTAQLLDASGDGSTAVAPSPPPQPLTEVQLGQVVAVAQALADLTLPGGATIYLPDERGVLARAGDLAFNDAPWLAGQPSSAFVRLVHPRISAHVAARLGTPSLRRLLLAASADSMALGTVGGAEAFGQSEALTTRLRHIIGDYPEGPGVLMELLQNADDAGATSLELMLDDTTYPSGSILSPAMAVWQGPALLVANDAVFSPSDFANISRIGQDSKASRPTSIGRFGLGFNAVYHFTDLPSFVSGDYLVIFDPHAKYLPGVSAAQPGLKIAFARAQLLQQFPDAFTPFTHLGCNMQERFMGTLFRFPLRGPTAAAASDIKTSPTSSADVAALLDSFRRQLPSALLFLKNIRTVAAYYRTAPSVAVTDTAHPTAAAATATATSIKDGGGGGGSVQLLFRATREIAARAAAAGNLTESAADARQLLVPELPDGQPKGLLQSSITRFIAGSSSADATDLPAFYKRLANTNPAALPSEMGLMQVNMETNPAVSSGGGIAALADAATASGTAEAEQLGSEGSTAVAASGATDAALGKMVSEQWLVCNAVGGGGARDMALKAFRNHGTKMVPWVGVAALVPYANVGGDASEPRTAITVRKDAGKGGDVDTLDGRAFCFLPLPIRTGLPVHVNGYFELSSNRRDIWYGGDMSGAGAARSSWNIALMADALAPCYSRMVVAVARLLGPCEQLYGETLFSDATCTAEPLLRNLLVALGMPLACGMPPAAEGSLLRGVPSATALEPRHVRLHLATMLRAVGGDAAAMAEQLVAAARAASVDIAAITTMDPVAATASKAHHHVNVHAPYPLQQQLQSHGDKEGTKKLPPLTAAVAALLRYCLSDLDGIVPATAKGGGGGGSNGGGQAMPASPQSHQHQQQQRLQRLQLELDGLPLLPLADGTLGRLQAHPHSAVSGGGKQPRGRSGAPANVHVYVLTRGSLELELLAELRNRCLAPDLPGTLIERLEQVVNQRLFNVQHLSPGLLDTTLLPLLLPPSWRGADEVEWSPLLQPTLQQQQRQQSVPPVTDDAPQPPPQQQQQQQSGTAATAAIAATAATAATVPRQGPTAEWVRALWSWLASREDVLQLASWPVLPIQGGRLGRLQDKSLVLREGDWTEAVSSALMRLGCRLLDTALLLPDGGLSRGLGATTGSDQEQQQQQQPAGHGNTAAVASPALLACVQQPSLTGVMAAIAAARARSLSPLQVQFHGQGGGLAGAAGTGGYRPRDPWLPPLGPVPVVSASVPGSSGLSAGPSWAARMSDLTVVERRQLRSYLLQTRWFAGASPLSEDGLELLRSLPIFEVYQDATVVPDSAPKPITTAPTVNTPLPLPLAAPASSLSIAAAAAAVSAAQLMQPALRHFTALDPSRNRLAPPDTDPRVLSSTFLRTDSPPEETVLEQYMGVPRLSHPELLLQHVGPRAAELPRDALGLYVAGLLGRLVDVPVRAGLAASAEAQRLREALSEYPVIPTASPAGDLRRASELHDPRVAALTSLLPRESAFFPAALLAVPNALAATAAATTTTMMAAAAFTAVNNALAPALLLDALGLLGMARAVDLRVLLTAANALQTDHAAWAAAAAAPTVAAASAAAAAVAAAVTEASLLSRARALLKQLEQWAAQYGTSGGGNVVPGREEHPKQAWAQLAALNWCPVLREAPEPGVPWAARQPLLAPPRVVRPPADAWLVGATLHIVERPVGQALQAALGWNVTPRVSVLAAQLIELGRLHAYQLQRIGPAVPVEAQPQPSSLETTVQVTASEGTAAAGDAGSGDANANASAAAGPDALRSSTGTLEATGKPVMTVTPLAEDLVAAALAKSIDSAVHKLYSVLSAAIDGPEGDLVAMSFERPDSPCVWVGVGFVLPGVAVLRSEGNFRPYLWVVPEPLHQYGRLLALMGVVDRFTAQHYASGLAALATAAGGAPLDDDSLAMALQLADCAADALGTHGRPMGPFFVPDASGVMTPSPELFFNDAEWLDARGVEMAHAALPQATAEALGVRSLRYAHEVEAQLTAALPCPSPGELRERLGIPTPEAQVQAQPDAASSISPEDAASTFLFELLELADALGLRTVRLVLDVRQHPAQSLLQPTLAAFQGPALCVVLPEVALSTEDLAAMLCSRVQPPSIRGRTTAYSAGLQSAFLVSELLQVVSGNSTYMFDPSGAYLGAGGAGAATGSASAARGRGGGGGGGGTAANPRAKQYVHVSSDLLSTFADQFAVWSFADGYDIRSQVNATLLRLPLRRASPAAAAGAAAAARERGGAAAATTAGLRGLRSGGLAVATLESVETALRRFAVHVPRSLLFLQCLSGIEVSLLRPPLPAPRTSAAGVATAATAASRVGAAAAASNTSTGITTRELLLQASLVVLDPDRPRPDFNAAAAVTRQRSGGGPAALKALALAFGRSLGRGPNHDNPKHYLYPLELHVMARNALLLPDGEPANREAAPPPSGGSVLGLFSSAATIQGNTLYRERWLVSSCHDLDGAAPIAAAAATGSSGRPELVAAAAVCVGRDDLRNLFPVSGLYAPVYLPSTATTAGAGAAGGGSALGHMPFLVAGHFYLSRRCGKHIVPPFGRANGSGGAGAAAPDANATADGGGSTAWSPAPASASAAAPPTLLPHLQHRCEHNRRTLDLVAAAWQDLAMYFCSMDNYNGPRELLYDIFPDMALTTAAASCGGAADETALYCIRQIYSGAARLPLWRLRTGRFVHLPEGCFLQPTTEGLGPAAMGFMARQLPLFDVPWVIKQHLEGADVHGLRTVSPAVVRPLLKNLGRRQGGLGAGAGSGMGGGKVVWPGLTVLEATELLLFCSADLACEAPTSATASTAAPASDTTSGPGSSGIPGQQGGGGVGGLLDELTFQVRNVVGELVGPALYDQLRQQAFGMLGEGAAAQQPTNTAVGHVAPVAAAAAAAAATPQQPRYHNARLQDCRGLPVPTAAGSIEPLGAGALLVAPPLHAAPGGPSTLLPPNRAAEFVHPDCVCKMAEFFKEPQYRARLSLRLYTLEDLARHLRTGLPPGWDQPMPLAAAAPQHQHQQQRTNSWVGLMDLGRAWDGGVGRQSDSPSGLWLWQLWALVNGLLDSAWEWQTGFPGRGDGGDMRLDPLQDWPLLPVLGSGPGAGVLLPVRHRRLVICLPSAPPPPPGPDGGKEGGSGDKGAGAAASPSAANSRLVVAAGPLPSLGDLAPALPAPWNWLAPALHAIGCPLLDPRFKDPLTRHCAPHPDGLPPRGLADASAIAGSAPTRGSVGAAAGAAISALVEKMRLCDAACGGALPRRCGSEWDESNRAAVLGLLAEATPTNIDPADIIFLRRLPIYPTHGGGFTALEEDPMGHHEGANAAAASSATASNSTPGTAPVVCAADLLQLVPGLESALPESIPRRLLLPQPGAARLYTLLDVPSLTAAGFLGRVVLPHLGGLPDGIRAMLLTHVQSNWNRLRTDESLLAVLRDTPFVTSADGALKRPSELYDPDHSLFAAAFLGCPVFPRDQFASPAWLTVLREAGMQHKVTAAGFLAAAEAVAARGAALHMTLRGEGVPEHGADLEDPFLAGGAAEVPAAVAGARAKVTAAAEQLVGFLAGPQGPTLGGGREWWAALAKVAFAPATLGLPGSRKARQLLTRYPDAAAASDWPLVWSVLPMVAADRQIPAALGQGQLRIRSPPPLAAVVAHLRRVGADSGEEALSAWPTSAGSVEDAFRAVLSYLDKEGVSGQKAAQLRDVAFVPVARATLLAPPRRLYVRLKEDFAPFAFEVPPSLASFTSLLKSLGAQDEPRAQDLVDSLRSLAASAGPQPLNPNQRAAIIRLLTHVAALGGAGTATGAGGGAVGGSAADLSYLNSARKERRLLVLSADGRLVPAHSAVSVGEGGGGSGAGRLLGRLDPGALTLTHPALSEAVTRWLGCPRLGDVAEERLDPGHPLEPVEQIQGLALRDARALLAAPTFVSACHVLLRTHAPLVRGMTTHGSLHEVAAVLRAAAPRLTFVRSLRTTAVLRATGTALSPAAEASRMAFDFVETAAAVTVAAASSGGGVIGLAAKSSSVGSGSGLGRIFIAEPPAHLPVSWLLASAVSRVLGSPVVLPIQPLFTIPAGELQQLQPVLLPGGFDAGLETATQAGVPGAPLLPADAALLQLKPLRHYCAGEVVAYQRTTAAVAVPAAAAAAAAERRLEFVVPAPGLTAGQEVQVGVAAATTAGGVSSSSSSSSNLCYGRVAAHCVPADKAAGASGGLHRVLVEVEPGVVQHLLSTQVFCFRSATGQTAPPSTATAAASSSTTAADFSAAASSSSSDAVASSAAAAAAAPDDASPSAGAGAGAGVPGSSASRSATPLATLAAAAAAAQPSSGGVLNPVSSSEMLAAVRDVMAAAGLPLDPAAGQLMGRVAMLQEKLEEAQEQLEQAKREAASSAAEAENVRGAWQCKICFGRDVDSAYTTCGHTICARCANAAGSNRCPVCRKTSQALLRLYRA
ncbi:hypothetical protein VaNZ11_002673 [Volvox africanus]|uniref:RING-type domain-containing protein n=1 Tax=Volvox africanus TaxID=51714 RepID=A0ABQ5RSC6_9CHLO|nr:hypothetical protein VaNZ11_002673 [Volvox africanus]